MRSPSGAYAWLLAKEWRELMASRAWWVMLLLMGPLVGVSFISAVQTYGELSGIGGTASGVGEAFSPLIGIWAPTFSACELAAAFLLPFVGIRLVSGDRQSGAEKLELQHSMQPLVRLSAKALVLLAGWTVASIAPLLAILLWKSYGGTLYSPELATVALGHLLNAGLTVSLAAATASMTEHPSTAAIATLAVTVGTWIVNFVAAIHGGVWEQIAGYTPTSMVAQFQHGLIRLDVVLIALALIAFGLILTSIWMQLGTAARARGGESAAAAVLTIAVIAALSFVTVSWDLSESRENSFAEADEAALRSINGPLRIEVHLAPEDPRRADLEHRALSKLRRVMPRVQVEFLASTSTGLFEQTAPQYGEIWYDLGGRRVMSRATTAEAVLETIYELAGVSPPAQNTEIIFRGHPLASTAPGASAVFYVLWPLVVAAAAALMQRRRS